MKRHLLAARLMIAISVYNLGPAFPGRLVQEPHVVQSVSGGRKKRKRVETKMLLSSAERKKLASFHPGKEKKRYVKELKALKGVPDNRTEALLLEILERNNHR